MSVMEFVLVAHAIIVGLAVAEILRGFAELIRASGTQVNYRLLLIAAWTLLLLLQFWWSVWRIGDRESWTFAEFMALLLPVGILYLIARLCFPLVIAGTDLNAYYRSVSPVIWRLVSATYASFALFLQPFVFGGIVPPVFASQIAIAVLALAASFVKSAPFQVFVIVGMLAQVLWRGLAHVISG